MNQLMRLFNEEEGQAMTEYGLLVGLIAIVVQFQMLSSTISKSSPTYRLGYFNKLKEKIL